MSERRSGTLDKSGRGAFTTPIIVTARALMFVPMVTTTEQFTLVLTQPPDKRKFTVISVSTSMGSPLSR